jgi:hypothetical protein
VCKYLQSRRAGLACSACCCDQAEQIPNSQRRIKISRTLNAGVLGNTCKKRFRRIRAGKKQVPLYHYFAILNIFIFSAVKFALFCFKPGENPGREFRHRPEANFRPEGKAGVGVNLDLPG